MAVERRLRRPAALAMVGVLAALPLAAERFTGETTNVVAVEVPVQVVRDGEPVRGLAATDFVVSEGRRKLKVTQLEVIDLLSPAPSPGTAGNTGVAAPPISARRHFLLLFDLAFSSPQAVGKARQAARDLVLKAFHPTDLVAVATYSATQGPQLALGFTSDRRQIDWAIDTLGLVKPLAKGADPLRLVVAQTQAGSQQQLGVASAGAGGTGSLGGDASSELTGGLGAALSAQVDQQSRQNQESQVIAFSRALADLAKVMGEVEGRKTVVFLSEGFDSSLLTGSGAAAAPDEMQQAAGNPGAAAAFDPATQPFLADTEGRHGNTRTLDRLQKTLEELRRADCTLQAVDIGGLRGAGDAARNGKEALFTMARETGGELYENWNDLGGAMGKMLQRTSVTYVLTVQPEELKLDGAYHRISVELKNAPRGTRVVARPGFYAPRPFAQRNPLERMLDAAGGIVSGEEGGTIGSAVLAVPFRLASTPTAYVPVVIEVDGPGLLANQQGDVVPTEIYAYALDGTGAIRAFFSQTLGLDLAKVGPQLKSSGLKFFGHLDLPAGEYSLRVLVRNARTGAFSLRALPVKVPAFAQAGPFLLPPLFPEAPGRWLMVREAKRANGSQDAPYPFLQGEQPYVPASRPALGAGQDARLALVAYNLGEGEVQAAAKVLGADGKEVQPAELRITGRERGGSAGPDRLMASLKAPQLAPGEYQLQVTLTGGVGGAQTSSILFVVQKPGARG